MWSGISNDTNMGLGKRIFDICAAVMLLMIFALPMLCVALLIKITSKGPVFYVSDRVGVHNKIFRMLKFRTMKTGTPPLATHLIKDSDQYVTFVGKLIRKTSIDELPQIWNILLGDMSFVGPRPALYNQDDLIGLRAKRGIDKIVPGLTGWAQIHGRDEVSIQTKVEYDGYYLAHCSFVLDLKILWKTLIRVVNGKGVQH